MKNIKEFCDFRIYSGSFYYNIELDTEFQAAVSISQGMVGHRLEFLIGDHILPYNMTVYQAIKQFSHTVQHDGSEMDTDGENPFGSSNIWVQTHTIW